MFKKKRKKENNRHLIIINDSLEIISNNMALINALVNIMGLRMKSLSNDIEKIKNHNLDNLYYHDEINHKFDLN